MKKLIMGLSLLIIGLSVFAQTYNVTISGIATDIYTGTPVANQQITLTTDTMAGGIMYYNTVFTNNSGYYTDVFSANDGEQGIIMASTQSCGTYIQHEASYSPNYTQVVIDFDVCTDTIGNNCQAMFFHYPITPLSIQFNDESIGNPDSWTWDFGDGNTTTEQHPVHVYSEYGEYQVSLTIENTGTQCNSTYQMLVYVIDSIYPSDCQAMFDYFPITNTEFQFNDNSLGNPNSWTWEFGDGMTSTEQNPVHNFSNYGEYIVTLTIYNDSTQCNSTMEQMVVVMDSIFPGACEAMFWAYPDSNNFSAINFQDISITLSGIIDSWHWDFGDGQTSTEQNPTHIYNDGGEYMVCLTITDSTSQCENIMCQPIWVGNGNPGCEAGFYYYPSGDSINPGNGWSIQEMQFIDASAGMPDTWHWDFGDGITSEEQNPIHYFDNEGVYNVCLTISSEIDSCFSTYCEMVYIMNDTIPTACQTWFDYEINDLTTDFTAYIEGNTGDVTYEWNLGDGTTAVGENISHTYADGGMYNISLTSYDSEGCYSNYFEVIWVGEITFDINGYVYLDDSMMIADAAEVSLMTFDTIANGLINVETTEIDENGYYEFTGVGVENCMYFVQAELTNQSSFVGQYAPTYHLDALYWEQAMPIFPFVYGWGYDIYMLPVSGSSSGLGNITGMVSQENTRGQLDDVEILLLDSDSKPIYYSHTNNQGNFDFLQLAYGTYTVYTEMVGINTQPVQVTLSEENNEQVVNIVVKNGEAILGIGEQQSTYIKEVGEIFPNPVTDNASVTIMVDNATTAEIQIINQYGQVIYENDSQYAKGKHTININTQSFVEGMYLIKVTSEDKVSSVRKFLKLR